MNHWAWSDESFPISFKNFVSHCKHVDSFQFDSNGIVHLTPSNATDLEYTRKMSWNGCAPDKKTEILTAIINIDWNGKKGSKMMKFSNEVEATIKKQTRTRITIAITPHIQKKKNKKKMNACFAEEIFFSFSLSLWLSPPSLSLMPLLLIVDCCFDVSKIVLAWVIRMSESQCMPRILWTTGKCYNFNSDRSFSTHSFSVKKKI